MSILQMSITAGVLVTAIVIIRAVALNRLPKKMFLVLWGLVLVRLLVPVAIPINIAIGDIVERVLPDSSAYSAVENTTPNPMPDFSGVPGITEAPSIAAGQAAEAPQAIFGIAPATMIWLAGMVAMVAFFAVIFIKNHRTLRFATLMKDNDFLNKWLAEHRHIRPIAIMQSDRIESPFAVGIIKPRIILPKSMDMNDRQILDYVLAHEYFHIKRFDALWKMLLLLAVCIHWFNPLVWLMFLLANRDLELTCDEAVIHRFGATTKKAYAHMLIDMAEQRGKFAPLYSGISKNAIQERIVSIMKVKKASIISVALAVVLVAVLGIGALSIFATNTNTTEVDRRYDDTLSTVVIDLTANDRTTTTTSTINLNPTIQASGPVVSQTLQLGNFSGISAGTVWEVVYRRSETHSVIVEVNENILEYLNVRVWRGILYAEFRSGFGFDFSNGSTPRIYVYAPYITELNLESLATAMDWDVLCAPELSIQTNGAGSIDISMEVGRLSVSSVGASSIVLSGSADTANITFSGAGEAVIDMEVERLVINNFGAANIVLSGSADIANIAALGVGRVMAFEMLIRDATIETDGFSRVHVNVSEYLNAVAGEAGGGESHIRYKGSPIVTSRTFGASTVEAYN